MNAVGRAVNGRAICSTAGPPGVLEFGNDVRPMIDGLPSLADRLGKGVLLVDETPSAIVIHFHEMAQCATGVEELPFGNLAMDLGCGWLGHGRSSARRW